MKKVFFAFTLLFFAAKIAVAQLPDGSIAPDFKAKDLTGKEWHLYDLLAQGKTVVMDISATWCGPCWFYHKTGALEAVHELYGPGGTNEIVVLFVEGDASTSVECLSGPTGCVGGTQGNWLAGTKHPVIDDASIAQLYDISYYPTVYAICPNRRVVEIGQNSPTAIHNFAQNCPEAQGTNNAGIFKIDAGNGGDYFCGQTTIQPSVQFQNLGNANLTAAKFKLQVNGSDVQSKNWSGNLGTFDLAEVKFDPHLLTSEELTTVDVVIEQVNGTSDDNQQDNSASTALIPTFSVVEQNEVVFEIRTDANGPETYWEFRDAAGKVLYSGGNPNAKPGGLQPNLSGGYNPNQYEKRSFFLPGPGCYQFYILDDGGNGLASTGFFKISDKSGTVLIPTESFSKDFSNWFKAENIAVAAGEVFLKNASLSISPNPTAGSEVKIEWTAADFQPSKLVLTDALGKITMQQNIASTAGQSYILPTGGLPAGVYQVELIGKNGRLTSRLVKNRD